VNDYGTHRYANVDRQKVDTLLGELRRWGAAVSGDNPWDVDTRRYGVKLRGRLNEAASKLEVTIVERDWHVPCSMIWRNIDDLVRRAQATQDVEIEEISRT
jgi:hypothetical protein